jgi:hypothetical protein
LGVGDGVIVGVSKGVAVSVAVAVPVGSVVDVVVCVSAGLGVTVGGSAGAGVGVMSIGLLGTCGVVGSETVFTDVAWPDGPCGAAHPTNRNSSARVKRIAG